MVTVTISTSKVGKRAGSNIAGLQLPPREALLLLGWPSWEDSVATYLMHTRACKQELRPVICRALAERGISIVEVHPEGKVSNLEVQCIVLVSFA